MTSDIGNTEMSRAAQDLEFALGRRKVSLGGMLPHELDAHIEKQLDRSLLRDLQGFDELRNVLADYCRIENLQDIFFGSGEGKFHVVLVFSYSNKDKRKLLLLKRPRKLSDEESVLIEVSFEFKDSVSNIQVRPTSVSEFCKSCNIGSTTTVVAICLFDKLESLYYQTASYIEKSADKFRKRAKEVGRLKKVVTY
jgi:hypothetical protein